MSILSEKELDDCIGSIKEDGVYMLYHDDNCRSITNISHYQVHYAKIAEVPTLDEVKTAMMRTGSEYLSKVVHQFFEEARATGKPHWSYHELADYIVAHVLK